MLLHPCRFAPSLRGPKHLLSLHNRGALTRCHVGRLQLHAMQPPPANIVSPPCPLRRFCATSSSRTPSTTSPAQRPFQVLGVQQVAIGSDDRAALRRLWVDTLGVPIHHEGVRIERENVVEDILSLDGVEIDLMTPIDPEKSPKVQ